MICNAFLIVAQTAAASESVVAVGIVIIGIIVILTYFLPTFIAAMRNHTSTLAIFIVNLVFGASGIGWIVALIWALADNGRNRGGAVVYQVNNQAPPMPTYMINTPTPPQVQAPSTAPLPTVGGKNGACPYCSSIVSARAVYCPHCTKSFAPGSVRPVNP